MESKDWLIKILLEEDKLHEPDFRTEILAIKLPSLLYSMSMSILAIITDVNFKCK